MHEFTDNKGRKWMIDVDVECVKRVRDLAKLDLLTLATGKLTDELQDPIKLVDALYAACKPAADAAGVSDVEFGRAMRGDAIETGTVALIQGVIDFFPKARAATLRQVWTKGEEMRAVLEKAIHEQLDQIKPADLLKSLRRKKSGGKSLNLLASQASTPIAAPTAS